MSYITDEQTIWFHLLHSCNFDLKHDIHLKFYLPKGWYFEQGSNSRIITVESGGS